MKRYKLPIIEMCYTHCMVEDNLGGLVPCMMQKMVTLTLAVLRVFFFYDSDLKQMLLSHVVVFFH